MLYIGVGTGIGALASLFIVGVTSFAAKLLVYMGYIFLIIALVVQGGCESTTHFFQPCLS